MVRQYSNTAVVTALSTSASDSDTSLLVGSVSGFPVTYPYTLSIDADNVSKEIVEVTGAAGTTLTVTRGVDGTSAVAHLLGAAVRHDHSARDFRESREHEAAESDVHGVSGALAAASDVTDVADDLAAHLADASDAHDASAISYNGSTNLSASDVEAALDELDAEKQPLDSDLTAIAALAPTNDDILQRKAGAWTNRTIKQLLVDVEAKTDRWTPTDYGFVAWSHDLATASTGAQLPSSANGFTTRVKVKAGNITNVHLAVTTAGATLTSGQCGVAIYQSNNLIGSLVTGVHTSWQSVGFKTHALASGPFAVVDGYVDVYIWVNGTTRPFFAGAAFPAAIIGNGPLTGSNARYAITTPSSITTTPPATITKTADAEVPFWVGLS